MAQEPENLVLDIVRALRADSAAIQRTLAEHGRRLTAIELGLSRIRRDAAGDAETVALESARIDGVEERLGRIERRLDLREA